MPLTFECRGISKSFGSGELREAVLSSVSVGFALRATCLLMGPSGSGKTTLLSILGGLLTPTSGEMLFEGSRLDFANSSELLRWRRKQIGFVFQHAQLLPFLNANENVAIIGQNAGVACQPLRDRIGDLFERLSLAGVRHKFPGQLSGGQRQRVAIARALVHRPRVILADEPTAALDWQHGEAVVRLLVEQAQLEDAILVCVTHDERLIPFFDQCLRIDRGRITAAVSGELANCGRDK